MSAVLGLTTFPEPRSLKIVWSSVTEADTFTASQRGQRYPDAVVTVEGTFGGATVLIVGSNDGTNFHTVHGQSGLLSLTTAGGDVIIENYPYLKATHSGGSSESITVTIIGASY